MKKFRWFFYICLMFGFSNPVWADSVGYAPITKYEVCSANNQFCAIYTVPNHNEKSETTTVYKKDNKEVILYTSNIFPSFISDDGRYIIESYDFWDWRSEKCEANNDDKAVSFYKDGILLKAYSALDIAEDKNNVSCSVSHYESMNAKRLDGQYLLVQRIDGGWLKFDITTGEIVSRDHLAMDVIFKTKRTYEVNFRLRAWLRLFVILGFLIMVIWAVVKRMSMKKKL